MKYFSSFISKYDFDSLLDVGCGKGLLFNNIVRPNKFKFLVGVDLIKNRKGQYQHVVADATRLPFKNSAFSLVTALSLIGYSQKFRNDLGFCEDAEIKQKCARVLIQACDGYHWEAVYVKEKECDKKSS